MQLFFVVDGQLFQEKMIMAKCRICGHDSHCDEELMKDTFNAYGKRLGQSKNVKCKYCRCEKCARPDWG